MTAAALAAGVIGAGRAFDNVGTSGLSADLETLLASIFEVAPFLLLLLLAAIVTKQVSFR
jgi:hypothetical protein